MVGYVTSAIKNGYEEKKTKILKKSELTDTQKRNNLWVLHKTEYYRHITRDVIKHFCILDVTLQKYEFLEFVALINSNDINLICSYKKLGENFDGFIIGIQSNDPNAILFFEDGFTENLIKRHSNIKQTVASFDEFLSRQKF